MPPQAGPVGVLLAHGAGAGQDSPFIVHIREGLAAAGYAVLTFNYPYAEEGRRRPDPQPRLLECHRAAAARLRSYVPAIVFAGKSMGGRIGSHVVADGAPASGLLFYGYPLVAPGSGMPRSVEHLHTIRVPMLFLAGTRDRLCPLDLLEDVLSGLPAAEAAIIEDGDHSFRIPARAGVTGEEVLDGLVAMSVDWLGGLA